MLEFDVACIPEPKLHPFDTGGEPLQLEFIKKLGKGIHSYVWKVRINGNLYALKMFGSEQDPPTSAFRERSGIEGQAALWPYLHAFPNEYRAFARLKEFGQEHLAVTCYGWIELDESHYEFMDRHICQYSWSEERYGKMKRYAIVKELLDFNYPLCHHEDMARLFGNPKLATKTFKGLKTMHNLGIFVGDIKNDNISWGKYVDFSRSWTAPHPFAADPEAFCFEGSPYQDAIDLEELVHGEDGWNILFPHNKIRDRLFPHDEYVSKLRSNKGLSKVNLWMKCVREWPGHPEDFSYEKAGKLYRRVTGSAQKPRRLRPTERPEPVKCEPCRNEYRFSDSKLLVGSDYTIRSSIRSLCERIYL